MGLSRSVAAALLAAALALIAGYSAVVPAFEAPDEPGHFHYVQRLASGQGLPVQGAAGVHDPELSQPPLYYSLQAIVAKLIPAAGAEVPTRDRQNVFQNTTTSGNVNLYSHPATEDFPWQGEVLQLHAMRFLNLLLAAMTLLATYGIARQAGLPVAPALASALALGFLPQFDFISGALNADNLVTATASIALYLLLRWLGQPSLTLALLTGVVAGAAMLSKLSGLAVLPLLAAVMLGHAVRDRDSRAVLHLALAVITSVAIGGWWYARNLALFGDPLGWQPMLDAIGAMQRARPLGGFQAAAGLLQARATAVGVFGWNNLRLSAWVYRAGDVVALLGLIGLVLYWRRTYALKASRGALSFLALWMLVFAVSLSRWVAVNTDAAQWRLLLPAFPALAVLLVFGLTYFVHRWVMLLPAGLALLSVYSLIFVVRPAYVPDAPFTGPIQHQLNIRLGSALEFAGFDDPQPRDTLSGGQVAVLLYWRALQPIDEADILDLVAIDSSGRPGWKESTWPQEGRAPTNGWRPGDLIRDRHVVATSALAPGAWTLQLDVYRPVEGAPRLPIDSAGNTTVDIGRFLVAPPQTSPPPKQAQAHFGQSMDLLGHREQQTSDSLQVGLQWRATAPTDRDYTVFVHLLDPAGRVVSQDDSQPAGGRFPTGLLRPGVTVDDVHQLRLVDLPAGAYQLEVGLYDPVSGQRLSLEGSPSGALTWPVTLARAA